VYVPAVTSTTAKVPVASDVAWVAVAPPGAVAVRVVYAL
jgi:hypothetical protein